MSDALPQGWVFGKMLDILDYEGGSQPPKKEFIYEPREGYVRLLQIRDFGDKPFPTYVRDNRRLKKATHDGLLLARYGGSTGSDSLGRICTGLDGAYNVALAKLIFSRDALEQSYVRYLFLGPWFREKVSRNSRSCQTGFNREDVEDISFPIAPLGEQRRIVAKLDKLLGKVDTCQQRLAKIPILLKRFRQSVLAAACSGRLTADWREEKNVDGDWPTRLLSEMFTMRNGKSLTAAKRKEGDIPVYGGNGFMGTHNAANADGQVIVIGRVGAQCGNVHFVSGKVWVTDNAISLEAKRTVEPAFYAFFLRSQNLNQLSAGTGQPYVSQEILGPIETPVVSLAEQKEIVRRVEALFALAGQIEARYAKAKAHVEKLTQSILAKAFRGELVPRDPNDEPASALLKRIRSERQPHDVPRRRNAHA